MLQDLERIKDAYAEFAANLPAYPMPGIAALQIELEEAIARAIANAQPS